MAAALVAIALASGAALAGPAEEELYHRAFLRLADGDVAAARALLRRLAAADRSEPLRAAAIERLAELDELEVVAGPTPPAETGREAPTGQARAELALGMTVSGVVAGFTACEAAECDSARGTAASLMIGGGGALGVSLLATTHGITPGHAQLLNSSVTWGGMNAFLFSDSLQDAELAWATLGGEAAGLGLGIGLRRAWDPRSGDVALTNTGGIWTTVLVLLGHAVTDREPEVETVVLSADGGLLLGAGLSRVVDVSRGRTLLIDIGGVLGFLLGGTVAIGSESDTRAAGVELFVGTAGGLALATALTRDWDAPEVPVRLALLRLGEGWGAAVSVDTP